MSTTTIFSSAKRHLLKGTNPFIDLDDSSAGAFMVALLSNTYTPNTTAHAYVTDLSSELSGSGYARQPLTGTTLTLSHPTVTFSAASPITFTASGGPITARYAVIFYTGCTPNPLLILVDFGEDKTADDGTQLKLSLHPDGIITLT